MTRFKLDRPSPALVIACIALFVALGGVGYAAATGSIDGREIKNNSVASKDIRNNSVASGDVRNSTLIGPDIRDNAVKGSDVDESSLGKVGSAGQADNAGTASSANTASTAGNANTVGGLRIIPFTYRSDNTTTRTPLASVGGLVVEGACGSADNDLLLNNESGTTAEITYNNVDDSANVTGGESTLAVATGGERNAAGGVPDEGANGQAGFITTANRQVRVYYTLNEDVNGFDCSMSGHVIG